MRRWHKHRMVVRYRCASRTAIRRWLADDCIEDADCGRMSQEYIC